MKILRSIPTVNPAVGGPSEVVRQSSTALIARGHEVEIVSLDAPDDPWVRECPVRVHALGPGRGHYGFTRRFVPWLAERRTEYDAVIVHGVWQYSSFGVWRALHGTGTPYFVFPHGMLDPWFNRTYPLKRLKKLLYWRWGEYRVLRDAAAVLFTSDEERRLARQSFSPYRCLEKVVNYGTAAPAIGASAAAEFFARFPHLQGRRIFLFLSRLHEKKGCDLLLEAFARVRRAQGSDLHLVMAGPPANESYREHLQKLAAAASGGTGAEAAVTFTGMLTGNLKWGAFRAAEAFVLPSHQENFGIAVVEAMASGTPVLISNQVNIWREIAADEAGYVENDDLEGTTRLLERWLQTTPEKRAVMQENAQSCFARLFEIQRAADSLLEVLTSGPRSPSST
ncbi:MAG: glycosyltransferase [Chthoniobacterales bacterium]